MTDDRAVALPDGTPGDDGPAAVRALGPLLGVAAGLAGLGVAEVLAGLVAPASAPLVALADAVVDLSPSWLREAAITAFGTADKAVLLGGAVVVALVLSGLAGVLAVRGTRLFTARAADSLVVSLGALASLAAATRPDATALSALPALAGSLAGLLGLRWAVAHLPSPAPVTGGVAAAGGPSTGPGPEPRPEAAGPDTGAGGPDTGAAGPDAFPEPSAAVAAPSVAPARRPLLAAAALAVAGLVSGVLGRLLGARLRDAEASRAEVALPAPAEPAAALPDGVELGVRGVVPFTTPNDAFYRIDTALTLPRIDAREWRLRIHGMVRRELTVDLDRILAGPLVERDITLICVSNPVGGDLTGNARWLGLPLGPLLAEAGPLPDADMVLSTSADGWTCSTPLAALTDGRDALLAVGMNGEPLPLRHGFPVRMVVPGLYGFVSATKWVVDLEVTRFDQAEAYWTVRGWAPRAPVKTGSRIDVPTEQAEVPAGPVAVGGIAWAQGRGVRAVEVSVDDGPWEPARLGAVPGPDTWRQWAYRWEATPGRHRLRVRATDGEGVVQSGRGTLTVPDGATGWHTISVTVS